jgi:hypothetical protein
MNGIIQAIGSLSSLKELYLGDLPGIMTTPFIAPSIMEIQMDTTFPCYLLSRFLEHSPSLSTIPFCGTTSMSIQGEENIGFGRALALHTKIETLHIESDWVWLWTSVVHGYPEHQTQYYLEGSVYADVDDPSETPEETIANFVRQIGGCPMFSTFKLDFAYTHSQRVFGSFVEMLASSKALKTVELKALEDNQASAMALLNIFNPLIARFVTLRCMLTLRRDGNKLV